MSLINDALKRAQASQTRSPAAAVHEPPLRPALELAGRRPPALSQRVAIISTVLVLMAVGIWRFRPAGQSFGGTVRPALSSASISSEKPVLAAAIIQPEPLPAAPVHPVPSSKPTARRAVLTAPQPMVSQAVILRPTAPQPALTRAAVREPAVAPPIATQLIVTESPGKQAIEVRPVIPESESPALTLQAIHYRLSKPSARINGRTVFRGDTLGAARVISIEREAVKLLVRGHTNLLTMVSP